MSTTIKFLHLDYQMIHEPVFVLDTEFSLHTSIYLKCPVSKNKAQHTEEAVVEQEFNSLFAQSQRLLGTCHPNLLLPTLAAC